MVTQIACHHCQQSFEAEAEDKTAFCPHCGRETFTHPIPQPTIAKTARAAGASPKPTAAKFFESIMWVCVVLAGIAIGFGFLAAIANGNGNFRGDAFLVGLGAGCSFLWAALICYVILILLRIEANTRR